MSRTWTAGVWVVVCSLSLGWALAQEAEKKGEAAKTDEARLQGTWIGREPREPVAGPPEMITMIVSGTQFELKGARPGLVFRGTLALNPAANPKQAAFLVKEGPDPENKYAGKIALAIYKMQEDGTLTVAANEPGVATRPEKFEPGPAQETKVFVFRKWVPGMILPGNPPELKVLEKRIGTWTTEAVIKPGPWNPTGRTITGTETTEWILGGRFQQTRSANRPANADGMFLVTYDPQLKAFRGWHADDQGFVNDMTGQWDEAAQTLNWTSEGKNGFRATASSRHVGPDHIEWQMVVKDPEGKVMLEMAGKLERKK